MRKITSALNLVILTSLLTFSANAASDNKLPKGLMKLAGQDAPALVLKNLDDEAWDITQSRGHWIFLHFWASWCGPCREEMPTIKAIVKKFKADEMEVVLVNTAESEDIVFEFIAAVSPELNPLLDVDGQVTELWQPRGLPATFFVDPEGKLQYLALGGREWDTAIYLDFLNNLIRNKKSQ